MEPYQHQELEPLREALNQRNQGKKFGQVFGQVLEMTRMDQTVEADICLMEIGLEWWTR